MVYISNAVLEKMDFESGFMKVFASIADTEFGSDSAHIYIGGVEKLENLSKRLSGGIDAFISRILLLCLVTSLVESKFLCCIRQKVCVDFASMCAGDAVRGPCSAESHE